MNVASFFCGAGGLDLGFHRDKAYRHVFATDFCRDSCETYRSNFGMKPVCVDIRDLHEDEVPDADLYLAGIPCQGFSRAGKRDPTDPRNFLFWEVNRIVRRKRPKYLIFENVAGILTLDGGRVLKLIRDSFQDLGYTVEQRLLNMADFGVPQNRRRVVFLISRNDVPAMKFPDRIPGPKRTLRDAIGDLPIETDPAIQHVTFSCPPYVNGYAGNRVSDFDKPSPTILTTSTTPNHPSMTRRLTLREAARIQTFPDDFMFAGSKTSVIRQIGNSVPPEFSKLLAREILR